MKFGYLISKIEMKLIYVSKKGAVLSLISSQSEFHVEFENQENSIFLIKPESNEHWIGLIRSLRGCLVCKS